MLGSWQHCFWNNYLDDPCHSYLYQPISFPKYSPFPRKKKPNSNLSTARKKKIKTQKCSTCISIIFCFFSIKLLFRFYNTSTLHWGVFTYLILVVPNQYIAVDSQCGSFRIFLYFRFCVKSTCEILEGFLQL